MYLLHGGQLLAAFIGYAGSVAMASAMAPVVLAAPAQAHGITERINLGRGGEQSDGNSYNPAISADGRLVAFDSDASTLVPGDTNNPWFDVFVRDRNTGTTQRVSLGPNGTQGNEDSYTPVISANGRFIAFASDASNLVLGDTNDVPDLFIRDLQTRTTRRVSLGPGGAQGNGYSRNPAISPDGRFIAFESAASNLVPDDTNGALDVFVRDRQTGTTRRVSLGQGGSQGNGESASPSISADGRFVAFTSDASNLVAGDTNGTYDVFVRDRQAGTTHRISLGQGGVQGNSVSVSPAISADGCFVAFESVASNLVRGDTNNTWDVFVRDRQMGMTRRVSFGPGGAQGNKASYTKSISADGRFVAFDSSASNLVKGDTNKAWDVFVRDRQTGTTRRVSLGQGGVQGNADVVNGGSSPAISANGRFVAFVSSASNLVLSDTNDVPDVFVHTLAP